jgi:hypothetical protein
LKSALSFNLSYTVSALLLLILFISRFDTQFAMTTGLLRLFFLTCVSAFVHPGLLINEVDITRIKIKLDAQRDPWLSSWNDLISLEYSSASYTNNAVPVVYRDDEGTNTANAQLLWHDAAAAFNLGLRWKVSGETQYAEAAAKILTAWGETLTSLGDLDDDYLTAGFQGHELANAAELLRDYAPFAKNGLTALTDMMTTVFLTKNLYFLNHRQAFLCELGTGPNRIGYGHRRSRRQPNCLRFRSGLLQERNWQWCDWECHNEHRQ